MNVSEAIGKREKVVKGGKRVMADEQSTVGRVLPFVSDPHANAQLTSTVEFENQVCTVPSVYLFVCLCVHLFVCPFVCLSVCVSVSECVAVVVRKCINAKKRSSYLEGPAAKP